MNSAQITIPPRLAEKLAENSEYESRTKLSLANFSPWLADNKVVFFPGYTDHSEKHIESVIWGAESLIDDAAWAHMTAQDASALIISILLHDSAMHLHPEGFLSIIQT